MSKSNGYNPNSLFALEHSLLGNNPVYSAQQFSDEESEESEDYPSRGVEAQAFDWDDAIALDYEEDTDPESESMSEQDAEELEEEDTARSMSWQNYGYSSRGFDLEDEDTPTYDVQSFAVEEEETGERDDDPLSHSNSLFALEQSVFGTTSTNEPAQQFSLEEPQHQPIESHAFDWDEAIALEYDQSTYPATSAFDWLPTDESSHSFGFEDEPPTYNVEAFEVEEEPAKDLTPQPPLQGNRENSKPLSSQERGLERGFPHLVKSKEPASAPADQNYPASAAYGFDADDAESEPKQEEFNNSQAYGFDSDYYESAKPTRQDRNDSAAIPVHATVVMPPSQPRQSPQPVQALSDDDFDEFERGTVRDRAADAEAFAADLAAILRGEKVYEPPVETPAEAPPAPKPQTQPASQSQAQSVPPKKPNPHDIFDQMGRNMAHATAFDLGTFSLEQRFDEFDRLLDKQESESLGYEEYPAISGSEDTSKSAQSFAFDEEELEADVAALSAEDQWQAMQFAITDDEDMEEIDRTHPPEVAMQMGLLFTISSANTGLITALKSKEKLLDPIFINPDLQKQNQSVLIAPIVKSSARDPKAWHLIDKNKKAYYVRLTATGDLEVHDAPPVPPAPPVPFNLNALNWQAIQDIQKSPGGMTGYVTILTDQTGQRFFMKGIYGTTRRMALCQYFLSLNPKIKVPQFKRLTQQQFQDLITHSKKINKDEILTHLNESTEFGKWTNNRYSEILLMSDVGGLEIEDLLAQDPRAIHIFDPRHKIGQAFFMLLGYILGCDVFVSNPDRLIKPKKHDNWHATLVPANSTQAIQDILLATLDNESSLLEKSPNLTPEEYCELLTTADLTRSEKLLRKYNDMAHGQTLEMVGVELIAEPDLNKSIPLRTFIAEMLRGLIAGLNEHPKITSQIKQNIPLLDTSRVDASSLQNPCISYIILGVNNARDTIFEKMEQVTPAVLSNKKSTHLIPKLFAAESGEIPDLGFNLQALVLRHLYLEHRRNMTVEQAQADILKRIK